MHPEIPQAVLVVHGSVMIIVSIFLVYTVMAYARNVAYIEGIVLFALSFLSVPLVISLDFFFDVETLANAARFSGACFALAGSWFFARDFVRLDSESGYPFGEQGGFDDGRDD